MNYVNHVLALALCALIASVPVAAQSERGLEQRKFPDINLATRSQGDEALANLGAKLPNVAAFYGMSVSELARTLREDNSAWIDRRGRLLFIDTFREPASIDNSEDIVSGAPFPYNQTFLLNSRPNAKRVIYLDFDGHTISGRAWNGGATVTSPPYTSDSDSSSFSNTELANMQKMWRQVAEDFAPFDVNVTTEDPGQAAITRSSTNDQYFGTRVVITRDNFDSCGCGGFAYLRAFDDVGDFYKPAFVFNTSLVGAGEAISHESGHNLGLSHDGGPSTSYYRGHGGGETGWAPIMGVGYYQSLVQWSKGEYSGATQAQDDFQLIQNYGAPLATDDHGDTNSGATDLAGSSDGQTTTLNEQGIISHRSDMDVFRFLSGSGPYSITIAPAAFSPNLDISAQLFNSSGALLASSNPSAELAASLSGSLAEGEYFLTIDGVGKGDPLGEGYGDYGSLGHYAVTATVTDSDGLATPVARIDAIPISGYPPLTVDFDGLNSSDSDGIITDYAWLFGDGQSDSNASTSNVYYGPGSYTATLEVTDDSGLTDSTNVEISVFNQDPIAVAELDIESGTAPLQVSFRGDGSYDPDAPHGSIVAWHWDYGDGNSSTQANPTHSYLQGGVFTPSLRVTDDQGATATAVLEAISVTPPAFVKQYAYADLAGSGTISGTFQATSADDGLVQSIRERESGGKPRNRYSYLEHTWLFNVPAGNTVTLHLNAWQSSSVDGDSMEFSYSNNGGASYDVLMSLENTVDGVARLAILPASTQGEVRVRVRDSSQAGGSRSLDYVYVDEIFILSESGNGTTVPAQPSGLVAATQSANSINISWLPGSNEVSGFVLARSIDGGAWNNNYRNLNSESNQFTDTGLTPITTYNYRLAAFNGTGSSPWSQESSTTTFNGDDSGAIALVAQGYKRKGVQNADLEWTGTSVAQVDIYRDMQLVATVSNSGSYTDTIDKKGSGTYNYEVCEHGSNQCSDPSSVSF